MDLHQTVDPVLEADWKKETRRRLDEISKGIVHGIPGEEVRGNIRQIVGRGSTAFSIRKPKQNT